MAGKKQTSKGGDDSPLTKKEMVNYIGPIFEELKGDTRRLEVIMDAMKREIMRVL